MLQAYRSFLVSHLSGVRCEELPGETADPAAFFNDKLRGAVLPAISNSERTPAKVEGKAKGLAWCENPECQAIRDQYHALIFRKEDGEAYPQSERERNEWQAGVRDFLGAMSAWTQNSAGTPAAFFREKIGFYNDLLAVVPNGDTRALVLRSMLDFLGSSRLDGQDRLQWELPVIQVAGRLALDPNGLGRLAGDVQRARDSVIVLETALEFLAPIPVNEFMLLL